MCYHPVRMLRPGYDSDNLLHSKMVSFPCRKCKECRDIISSEYAFRTQQETFRCIQSEGLVFFNTFTYADTFLPILWYRRSKQFDIHSYPRGLALSNHKCISKSLLSLDSVTTWNKKHIQNFIKRLRRFLDYYFGIPNTAFRYFVTTERGSDRLYQRTRKDGSRYLFKATERPHYHSIFWVYNVNIECIKKLPDWCNGFVMLKDVLPFAFKHFWFYGHVDDCKLSRTPAVASKYVTKYITKQSGDKLLQIDLHFFHSHNHDIDFKDMKPFFLCSNGIGANYVPSFDELTGNKKVAFESSHKSCSISLPRYYIKKYLKKDVLLGVKTQERKNENWTSKDGYIKRTVNQLCDNDFVPLRISQKSNDLGDLVDAKRYSNKVLDFFNEICSFVRFPDTFLRLTRLYNSKVHDEINNLNFRFLRFHSVPEHVGIVEDKQITLSQHEYDSKYASMDLDEFAAWLDEIDAINQTDKTYIYYEPSYDPRKLLVESLDSALYVLADTDYSSLLDKITLYYHYGVDSCDDVLISLQTLDYFFSDCKLLRNSLKRYVADCLYRNNLTQMMIDYPELFSPVEIDEYFSV